MPQGRLDFESVLEDIRRGAPSNAPTDLPGVPRLGVASHAPPPPAAPLPQDLHSRFQRGFTNFMDTASDTMLGGLKGAGRSVIENGRMSLSDMAANQALQLIPRERTLSDVATGSPGRNPIPDRMRPGYVPPEIEQGLQPTSTAQRYGGYAEKVAEILTPLGIEGEAGQLSRSLANLLERAAVPELRGASATAGRVLEAGAGMPTEASVGKLGKIVEETTPPRRTPISEPKPEGFETPFDVSNKGKYWKPRYDESPYGPALDAMQAAVARRAAQPSSILPGSADASLRALMGYLASHGNLKVALGTAATKLLQHPLVGSGAARALYAAGPVAETGAAIAANLARDQPSDTDVAGSALRDAVTRLLTGPQLDASGTATIPRGRAAAAPTPTPAPAPGPPIARGRALAFLPPPRAAAPAAEPPGATAATNPAMSGIIAELLGKNSPTSVGGIGPRPELGEPPGGAPEMPTSGPMGPTRIGPDMTPSPPPEMPTSGPMGPTRLGAAPEPPSPPLRMPSSGPLGPTKIGAAPRSEAPSKPAYVAKPAEFTSALDRVKQRVQAETGYGVKVISGTRTAKQQSDIFKNQKPGAKATNADGFIVESKHQSGEAADLRFVDKSGKVLTPKGNDKLWKALGKIAKEEGLVWGGDWTDPYDPGHVQLGVELKRNQ